MALCGFRTVRSSSDVNASIKTTPSSREGTGVGSYRGGTGQSCRAADAARLDNPRPNVFATGRDTDRKNADFIVLDANPVDDITNTRKISQVILRGAAVDRSKLPN